MSLILADARAIPIADNMVQAIITSPPFWNLRDYGLGEKGIGLEETAGEYAEDLVLAFRQARRALRPDGTLWLNLGDCYADKELMGMPWRVAFALQSYGWHLRAEIIWAKPNGMPEPVTDRPTRAHEQVFLFSKSDRYFYDAEAVKEPNTEDMLARAAKGYTRGPRGRVDASRNDAESLRGEANTRITATGRNLRDVWAIVTQPYHGAHFATFPEKLVEPCILAGTSDRGNCPRCGSPWERVLERTKHPTRDVEAQRRATREKTGRTDGHVSGPEGMVDEVRTVGWQPTCQCSCGEAVPALVLDPFCGSGTTGVVAQKLGRAFVGLDLKAEYLELARERIAAAPVRLL